MKTESFSQELASYTVMEQAVKANYFSCLSLLEGAPFGARIDPSAGLEKQSFSAGQGLPSLSERVGAVLKRLPSTEEMEPLFSRLRGVDLILATLSYGLGVRVSDLRSIRIRDVNLVSRQIALDGIVRPLPLLVVDDLRDYIHERLCGSEATVSVSRRDQRLFSERDLATFFKQASECQRGLAAELQNGGGEPLTERCLNRIFRLLGRFHVRRALRRGASVSSPLDLFDKGPRIVRRGRRGAVDAYYLWRAVFPAAQQLCTHPSRR